MPQPDLLAPGYRALLAPRRRALVIGALGASFIASLDSLIVVTALPTAARDVGGLDRYAVAVGAYAVAQVVAMAIGGALSDRVGPYRTLVIGAAVFAVGTVVGGTATSMLQIAGGRLVQGFGAGFMLSVPAVVWTLHLPASLHGHAFGLNSAVWGVSAVLGPPLGSLLTATLGWRYVFWVNLPVLAGTVLLAAAGLRGRRAPAAPPHRVNIAGPVLLGAVVTALLTQPVLAVLPLVLFVLSERRAREPVIPRHRSGLATCIVSFALGVSFIGAEGYLPLDLQSGAGWSVFWASVPLVTATLAWTVGSMLAARLPLGLRAMITLGAAIVVGGTALMAVPVLGGLPVAFGYTLGGLGMGLASPALFGAVLSDAAGAEGRESAAVPVARTVGGGVGTAIVGGLLVGLLPAATMRSAEAGAAPLPRLHAVAQIGFGVLAAVALAAVPATRHVRAERRREPR